MKRWRSVPDALGVIRLRARGQDLCRSCCSPASRECGPTSGRVDDPRPFDPRATERGWPHAGAHWSPAPPRLSLIACDWTLRFWLAAWTNALLHSPARVTPVAVLARPP